MRKLILLLPFAALISACSTGGTASGPSVDEYLNTVNTEVTYPGELYEESEINPVAFERKYDRKFVLLTGWVDAIKEKSVTLESMYTMQSSTFGPTRQKGKILCNIPTERRDSILLRSINEKVIFAGKIDFTADSFMGNIYLDECIVFASTDTSGRNDRTGILSGSIFNGNSNLSGLRALAMLAQEAHADQLTLQDMKELLREEITGVSIKETQEVETKQTASRDWSNDNPDAVLKRMKEIDDKKKLLAIRDLDSYESAKTEEFVKVKCNFADGTRGEEKCLGKWVEGFGWHTLIFTEFVPPYDSKKHIIVHSQGNWESDGTCFKYIPKDSQGNSNKSRIGRKSNSKAKVQSTKIHSVCASRVPIAEMKNIGGLWSRVDLENKS